MGPDPHHRWGVVLPEVDEGGCCMGAAARGPEYCTCWQPVHDLEQVAPCDAELADMDTRATACVDCAFRAGSPERRSQPGYGHSADDLDELIYSEGMFACHEGMRRIVALVHPSGVRVEVTEPNAYDPPRVRGVVFRADGTPALHCGGLAAVRAGRRVAGGAQ